MNAPKPIVLILISLLRTSQRSLAVFDPPPAPQRGWFCRFNCRTKARVLFGLLCVMLCWARPLVAQRLPPLDDSLMRKLVAEHLATQQLQLEGLDLPRVIERDQVEQDSLLQVLSEHGVIERRKTRVQRKREVYGVSRYLSVGAYEYRWPQTDNQQAPGVYYGRPELLRLIAMDGPYQRGERVYAELFYSFQVVDRPAWTEDQRVIRQVRKIRRARESATKPFESRVYLLLEEDRWRIWQAED